MYMLLNQMYGPIKAPRKQDAQYAIKPTGLCYKLTFQHPGGTGG